MSLKARDVVLMPAEIDIITRGEWLSDIHINNFQRLLQSCSDYRPVDTLLIQHLDSIEPIPRNRKHIQILHSSFGGGHWVCSYYDAKNIFIYDSLNTKMLYEHHKQFLTKLFTTHDFIKYPVQFPTVQSQPNGSDCGVFAIAFAVSLLFNIKPEKVRYDHNLMRSHLTKIFESNVIEHFPQDLTYGIPQKVLPLAVIKRRQVDADRKRIQRQYRKEYNILNQLKDNHNSQQDIENLENHNSQQDIENLENNRTKRKQQYLQNLEYIRTEQRRRYDQDLERNRTEKRRRYEQDVENNRSKKRRRYNKNVIKERAQKRKRYCTNFEREQERQKNVSSDRKWLYNKRYYQKRRSNSIIEKKNNIAKNICKKYDAIRSANSIKIRDSPEVFVKNILHKLNVTDCSKDYIEKRLEAEKVIRCCMHLRDNYIRNMRKMLYLLKNKSETCLTVVAECSTPDDKLHALCGISRHTASSENYFVDSTYHSIISSEIKRHGSVSRQVNITEPLIMNTKGAVENVLPLIEAQGKKSWLCSSLCKTNEPLLIDRYQKLLEAVNACTLKNVSKLMHNIFECTVKTSKDKLGHTNGCYIDLKYCKAMFVPLQLLSPHFPKVRDIRRFIYQLRGFHENMLHLDEALYSTDLNTLNEIATSAQEKVNTYKHEQTEIILSDDDVISKYHNAFMALKKRSLDTPRYTCVSCERLCYKRSVSKLGPLKRRRDIPIWKDLMAYVEQQKIDTQYICRYCDGKFRSGVMPAYCVLNNLSVNDVPEIISSLNDFEKLLVQRAKAFQTVLKMGTVINKRIPERQKIQKVKGRTFHLPLPLQHTLNKLCSNTDPINLNHEFFILIRNVPTKSKIIWEDLVDITKVFQALRWFRNNNFLYSEIVLPDTHDKLVLGNLDNVEYDDMQETENNTILHNDEREPLNNLELHTQEIKDHVEVTLDNQCEAMLTQKDKDDSYYEQYTVYPLHEKKENETATALYQMLKIMDTPLDSRERNLDLMCFPDLFPFGCNGQYDESRPVKLQEHEFIKCRLTSKHPQFRLNQQYLFYLLNNANMRQLSRGIYHKMNITNPRSRYTAAEYLEAVSKEALESDLSTIFSSLRNTEQYWRRPRSDLLCMIQHYGPVTWFLTFSPAEWWWDDLGEYIREANGWQNCSLSTSALVAKDPVSTSRFVDNKFRAILDFICSKDAPIGEVKHYFWRREYQGRGIQHFHMLVWIKDAPIYGECSNEEVSKFILKHVTCKMPDKKISPVLHRRVNTHQRHKHNQYCLRSKKIGRRVIRRCRFGFPRPVTETLHLRDVTTAIAGRKQLKHKSRLYDLPRTKNEVDINDYNSALLTAWEGNMDIQYVGEKSAILSWYLTKYLNKAGKSELSDFEFANSLHKDRPLGRVLWNFCLRSINNRECGALEAADTLLGIPLYGTDRNTTIKWLDVNLIRQRKLKKRQEIEALDGESTEIFCPSVVDNYYPNRPKELESVCLYEFVQWYDITTIEPRNDIIEYYKIDNSHYLKRRQRECLINHYKYNVNNRPEDYFFSLLLMFKPWRKLEDLRDCDTYAQSFHKVRLHCTKALQYHEKLEELKKAFETAEELVRQLLDEELQKNVSQDDPDNPIGVQNIEAGEAMQDFRDLGNKIDEKIDVSEMISKLNTDQKRIFDKVIDTVRSDNSILRLYVSGEGGTGKSFLIKTIKCWIKQYLNKDTALAAPTGIAAFNIDGLTVHRLLQLPVEHGGTPKYKQLSDHVLKVLRAELKDVVLFVIDEVSMISDLTFMYIHLRLSEIFDTKDCEDGWFGRKHILLCGDLLQLPPVREPPAFVGLSNDKINKYIGSLSAFNLWTLFDYDELTINVRQQEDDTYRQLLSRIRVGLLTKSDCEILESRKIHFKGDSVESRLGEVCNFITDFPSDIVCLLPTRHMCHVLNIAMLDRIPSKEILLIAEDTIDCVPYVRKKVLKVLSNNDDDNTKTAGLSKEIVIKIGAKVMIRRNIDPTLGLVNGTIATVLSVISDVSTGHVEKINLLLASGLEYSIERVSVKFEVVDRAFVIRKQFPLCLSSGITIHKSQGLSLQNAIIDTGNSIFNFGQVYVALSRVTSLQGLHLINFDPSSVIADTQAITEYNRLRYKYKPEAEIITVSKERYRKVKDVPWTLSKGIASVQDNCQSIHNKKLPHNIAWVLHGFQNIDHVSCYANAVLQCLMHLSPVRKQLLKCDKSDVLRTLMHRYENGMHNLKTYAVRQYLGEPFSINVKRDVFEFLTILCTKYDCISQLVEHQVTSTTRCKSCDYTKEFTYKDLVISIPINNLKEKSYNLNDLLNTTFSHWCQSDYRSCEQCTGNNILFKNELTLTKDIVIIRLLLFSEEDKTVKAVRKFNICAVPTTKVLIAGQLYKIMNAIFHSGLCIEDGHYTSMCREERSNYWTEADDEKIKNRQWPRGAKDINILFLQKIDSK